MGDMIATGEPYRLAHNLYDWPRIFNGDEHRLTPATFGSIEPLEFGRHVRKAAARRDVRVTVRTSSRPPVVAVRAVGRATVGLNP